MQEVTQHLLNGVVGLSCVDPTLHPCVSAAPLVVSIIAQQCAYVCHVASSSQALLSNGGSIFWRVLQRVALARERFVSSRAPPPLNLAIPSRRGPSTTETSSPTPVVSGATTVVNESLMSPRTVTSAFPPRAEPITCGEMSLLSSLEFRIVVVGGGRVGRAIVERLLQDPGLVHPSRITIITRQPDTVAQFANRGVRCTERTEGREALRNCHVLVIACQQTQFYEFVKTYFPRVQRLRRREAAPQNAPQPPSSPNTNSPQPPQSQPQQQDEVKQRHRRRQRRRTLKDVVDKWRSADTDPNDPDVTDESLLAPGTLVFSCCAALGTHKLAQELHHLEPLIVRADVDFSTVHTAAAELSAAQAAHRARFIQRIAIAGNAFLTKLQMVQQSHLGGEDAASTLRLATLSGSDALFGDETRRAAQRSAAIAPPPPDMSDFLRREGVSGGTLLLLQIWRALRCAVVVRQVALPITAQRPFAYLQRIGPLLGALLVALPKGPMERVLEAIIMELVRTEQDHMEEDEDELARRRSFMPSSPNRHSVSHERRRSGWNAARSGRSRAQGERQLFMLERRVVDAYDSDEDGDDRDGKHPFTRELARLVECFPNIFQSEAEALRYLQERYNAVTSPV